jgi:hypothetical protein
MTLRRQQFVIGLSGLAACSELDAVLTLIEDLCKGLRVRAQVIRVCLVAKVQFL